MTKWIDLLLFANISQMVIPATYTYKFYNEKVNAKVNTRQMRRNRFEDSDTLNNIFNTLIWGSLKINTSCTTKH